MQSVLRLFLCVLVLSLIGDLKLSALPSATRQLSREELIEEERALEAEFESLKNDGYSVSNIRRHLDDPKFLQKAFRRHFRFQQRLDHYFLSKLLYVIDEFKLEIDSIPRGSEKLEAQRQKVLRQYEIWLETLKRSRPRITVIHKNVRAFFSEAGEFYSLFERENTSVLRNLGRGLASIPQHLKKRISLGLISIRFLPQFLAMLRRFNSPPKISAEIAGQYPFSPTLNRAAISFARQRGLEINYTVENGNSPKPGSLELFVSVHRDIYLDPIIMAHFPETSGHRIFMAPNRYFPKFSERDFSRWLPQFLRAIPAHLLGKITAWLEDRSRRNPDFLPTGEERTSGASKAGEGVERLRTLLSPTTVNRAVIYPEGTGSLIGNLGYVHPSFILQFVLPFIRNGIDLRLRILSYDIPPGLRSSASERLTQLLYPPVDSVKVKVSSPWTPDQLKALINLGSGLTGKVFPSYLIRAEWIEQLPTNDDLLFGQLRLEAFERDVRAYLSRRLSSGQWENCDQLIKRLSNSTTSTKI